MNKKILPLAAGVAAAVIAAVVLVGTNTQDIQKNQYLDDNLALKQRLAEHGISMSSPIKLQKPDDVAKYCSFFTSEEMQNLVEYCTSTELNDKDGKFLGNIHMVGSKSDPKIALVLIQTDPFMSQIDSVKTVFDQTIQALVCDCWEKETPDGFATSGEWVDGLRQFHLGDTKPHSKSKQLSLESKHIQLELTTNQDGYLWHLFIYDESV